MPGKAPERKYDHPDGYILTDQALRDADPEIQMAVMRHWFLRHYEDPGVRTPYESREGGFIWIWGGPFDAHEQLDEEFGGMVADEVIAKLGDDLFGLCPQWTSTDSPEDYEKYFIENILLHRDHFQSFEEGLAKIRLLLGVSVESSVATWFYQLLYANVITVLETYLSDTFIGAVVPNTSLMRRFVETTPEFQHEKVSVAEAYEVVEGMAQRVRDYLADVVWHNLGRVKGMYRDSLSIAFPDEMGELFRAVATRHHIIHRNGRTKDGERLQISRGQVARLAESVEQFGREIDRQMRDRQKDHY